MYGLVRKKYHGAGRIISFILVLSLVFSCFMYAPDISNAAETGPDPANNGLNLTSLTPEHGIVFGGDGMTKGMGFKGDYYFLSTDNMAKLRSGATSSGALGLGDSSWFSNKIYSAYDEHAVDGNFYYFPISGINLISMARELGISAPNLKIAAYADGFNRTLSSAFTDRYYFAAGATESSIVVPPALALLEGGSGSSTANRECETLVFGQSGDREITHCNWVHDVYSVRFDTEQAALTIKPNSGSTTAYDMTSLVNLGVYHTSYSYYAKGFTDPITHKLTGVPLSVVLADAGIVLSSGQKIVTHSTDSWTKAIPYSDVNKWFVAYDGYDSGDNHLTNDSSLRLYGPGTYGTDVVVKSLTSLEIQSAGSGGEGGGGEGGGDTPPVIPGDKAAYANGDDISNEVFFIAFQPTAGADVKYYYYTKAELKDYEKTQLFHYDDHSTIKNVTAQGAKLSDLLADLDTNVNGNLKIQYLEADGYHAQAGQADAYQDNVAWLTTGHSVSVKESYGPMNTMIAYGINEQYEAPDDNNVNDPTGDYKDADNNTGYLRAYRDRGDANSTVLKYLVGVAISPAGNLANANTGFTLKAVDASKRALTFSADVTPTIKGLITGMKYSVKAPKVMGAALKSGEADQQVITVGTGTTAPVTFTYTESPYFYVKNGSRTTNYTFSQIKALGKQVPEAMSPAPYGYLSPMFYRYNGMWLSDMLKGITDIDTVKLVAKDGSKISIAKEDIGKYFIAYNNTESKTSTNTPEGKRVTLNYGDAKVIVPGDGTAVTESSGATGAAVSVKVAEADGVVVTVRKAAFNPSKDDISNEVFFVALQPTAGADVKYFYYTKAELEAFETTHSFRYDDHSTMKTVTAQGVKLSDLLESLDTNVDSSLKIQYLEADGFHAQAGQADAYQDNVAWLTTGHSVSVRENYGPMNTMITYGINEQYDVPDANNVNDPDGDYKDADNNTGYLRAYRERSDANSSVLKYLVGVAISPAGNLANANTGFTLKAVDATGSALTFSADVTPVIKGLITGMKYSVKAPRVMGAALKSGESDHQVITVGTGTSAPVTFTYTESPYFYVKNGSQTINFTFSQMKTLGKQVPNTMTPPPYGYSSPMFYRYNGMWLSDMLNGISDFDTVKFVDKNGGETYIAKADIGKYFVAYNNTESKTSTNTPEGKRITVNYYDAKVIAPGDGTAVTEVSKLSGAAVSVKVAEAEGVVLATNSGGGGGGGGAVAAPDKNSGVTKQGDKVTASVSQDAKVDSNGKATVAVDAKTLTDALKQAVQAVLDSNNKDLKAEVKIEVKASGNLQSVESNLPASAVKDVAKSDGASLTVATPILSMTFDTAALKAIADKLGGNALDIVAAIINPDKVKLAQGAEDTDLRAVFDLSLTSNGSRISSFGAGQADVSIPWTPGRGDNAAGFYVVYIDENGSTHRVTNSRYNEKTGCIEFETGHYSNYAIAYDKNKASLKFSDVAGHWAESSINFVVGKNLFQGTTEKTFDPNGKMTRAMFVTVLGRASGIDVSGYQKSRFKDVAISQWYGGYVEWAADKGIVSGVGNGSFDPNQSITREQMAMILDNYFSSQAKGDQKAEAAQLSFADKNSIASWAQKGVAFSSSKGYITGYPDGTFGPKKTATRAEVATILSRCSDLF